MEVNPANPGRNADAQQKSDHRAGRAQRGSFRGEKSVQQAVGSAQRLHNGKVAAAVEDPSHQRGEHAQRGRENDERSGGQKRGASLA